MTELWRGLLLITLLASVSLPATAGEETPVTTNCSAKSGEQSIALLELYTSEGCNSCPPADEWLRTLPERGLTRDRVIPLALHVDYWNYLGWEDPFSQSKFTQRQRRSGAMNRLPTIYTPQFLLNGQDFRSWTHWEQVKKEISHINATPPRAHVQFALRYEQPDRLHISGKALIPDATERRNADVYVVIYESGLIRAVRAGENAGRTLHHDFVAREFIGPLAATSNAGTVLKQSLHLPKDWNTGRLGVVVFVQNRASGDILQALALPLCAA